MQNFKYHIITILALLFFSYTVAITISQIIKYSISPTYTKKNISNDNHSYLSNFNNNKRKNFDDYREIIEAGFFQVAEPTPLDDTEEPAEPPCPIADLTLMGTITGSKQMARAMIKKKSEKNADIFALKEINDELDNNVYGNKLIKIENSQVTLETNGAKNILYLFGAPPEANEGITDGKSNGQKIVKNISRAEIQQKVLNNIDNAMRGLRAGPYRVNGQIEGYRLIRVRPYNILYKLGARNGDIAKRINGHAINSTEKLIKLWQTIKNDSQITVDIERRGKPLSFHLNITD